MHAQGITPHLATPKNHSPLARVDRFHLTLRQMLKQWFLATGHNNWVDSLPAIEAIRFDVQTRAMHVAARVDKKHLEPGTLCGILSTGWHLPRAVPPDGRRPSTPSIAVRGLTPLL